MLTEKECAVIRSLIQDEIAASQEFMSRSKDEVVKMYIGTLEAIESKFCSAEMILTV